MTIFRNITTAINWPQIKLRLGFEYRRIKSKGVFHILHKATGKMLSVALWFFLFPLTLLLHLNGYRRVTIFTDRIGHLAIEPDCLLKEQALGHISKRKWIMLAPPGRVANQHLLSYWEPYFLIIRRPMLCYLIDSMSKWLLMRYDISHYILASGKAQAAYRIFAEWGDRPPILKLSAEDEEWAEKKLKELGLPEGAWFVCVHVREPGFSPVDEELHAHRNACIQNTIPAIQEITGRGGWVVRIGDPTMSRLVEMPQVIDYAHHPFKSARMDIILCAKAKFLLGNTSGICLISSIFGVPCALANMTLIPPLWFTKSDISIPKLIWLKQSDRYLQLSEIFNSEIANYQYAPLYYANGWQFVENSSFDICSLVCEMLDRLNGCFDIDQSDEENLHRIKSLFYPNHYTYGSAAEISVSFLRNHPELLAMTADDLSDRWRQDK